MKYTIRVFVAGRDRRLDEICRTFSSMERTAYNLLMEGTNNIATKATLRERYGIRNARWIQSATNQSRAVMVSQEEGVKFRIEMYREKVRNADERTKRIANPLKVDGLKAKARRLQLRVHELERQLENGSFPGAVFGSKDLLRRLRLSSGTARYHDLREQWRESRSNHFFSIGQANQHGNSNTKLLREGSTD